MEPSKKDSDKDLAGKLDPKKDSGKEDSGILGTSGDFAAPTVAKPEFRGGVNGSDTEIYHLSDFTGGVSVGESPILEMPEYTGPLSTSEESVPTVEKQNLTGGVNVVASPMHDNNRDSKNEATMKTSYQKNC